MSLLAPSLTYASGYNPPKTVPLTLLDPNGTSTTPLVHVAFCIYNIASGNFYLQNITASQMLLVNTVYGGTNYLVYLPYEYVSDSYVVATCYYSDNTTSQTSNELELYAPPETLNATVALRVSTTSGFIVVNNPNDSNIQSYNVYETYFSSYSQQISILNVPSSACIIHANIVLIPVNNLIADTEYSLSAQSVTLYNTTGNVSNTVVLSSVPAPAPPSGLDSQIYYGTSTPVTDPYVTLTWTASEFQEEVPVQSYNIYEINGSYPVLIGNVVGGYNTTFITPNLTPSSTPYEFFVTAVGFDGDESLPSNSQIVNIPLASAPASLTAGTVPTIDLTSFNILLTWPVSGNQTNAPVTGYNIYRSTDGTNFTYLNNVVGGSSTTYTDSGSLTVGVTYSYYIKATGLMNTESDASPTASASLGNPEPPQNVEATLDSTVPAITITWEAPTNISQVPVVEYKIYQSINDGPFNFLAGVSGSTFTYTTLSTGPDAVVVGNTYAYKMIAVGLQSSQSGFSNTTNSITVYASPTAPQNLIIVGANQHVNGAFTQSLNLYGTTGIEYVVKLYKNTNDVYVYQEQQTIIYNAAQGSTYYQYSFSGLDNYEEYYTQIYLVGQTSEGVLLNGAVANSSPVFTGEAPIIESFKIIPDTYGSLIESIIVSNVPNLIAVPYEDLISPMVLTIAGVESSETVEPIVNVAINPYTFRVLPPTEYQIGTRYSYTHIVKNFITQTPTFAGGATISVSNVYGTSSDIAPPDVTFTANDNP